MTFNLGDPNVLVDSSPGDDAILLGAESVAAVRPTPYKWRALWAYILSKAGDSFGYAVGTSEGTIPLLGAGGKLPFNLMDLNSVPFTGTPTAPTASLGTNTTQLSTTAFVQAAINALIAAAPGALNTLDELAAALGDDPNYVATLTAALALKAPLASPALTGTPTAPTAAGGTSTTQIATTAFAQAYLNVAEAVVASASTTDIGATTSVRVEITGTTTITSLGSVANRFRFVRFSGALTLTHNATTLILPTGANITTAAGDMAIFASNGSGQWRCLWFGRASGRALTETRDTILCAEDILAGEEGFAIDAPSRSALIADYSGAKSNAGKPEDLLTVTRSGTNAGYVDRDRVYKYAAANTLRYQHDPVTGVLLGILVEPAATNLLLRSEELDVSPWSSFQTTVAANSAAGPTGALTLEKIVATALPNSHTRTQTISGTTNTSTYVFSHFVRQAEFSRVHLAIYEGTTLARYGGCTFNASTGTVVGATSGADAVVAGSGIEDWGGGLYRCWVAVTLGGTDTNINLRIALDNGTSTSFTGDGTSGIHIGCGQFELGSQPTSYIPTAGTTATRNADAISILTSALPGDPSVRGTLFVEARITTLNATGFEQVVVEFNNGTNADRCSILFTSGNQPAYSVLDDGVAQAFASMGAAMSVGQTFKAAVSFATNDIAGSRDGSTVAVDNVATIPTATHLYIGRRADAASLFTGIIRRVAWFTRDFTDAELQAIAA